VGLVVAVGIFVGSGVGSDRVGDGVFVAGILVAVGMAVGVADIEAPFVSVTFNGAGGVVSPNSANETIARVPKNIPFLFRVVFTKRETRSGLIRLIGKRTRDIRKINANSPDITPLYPRVSKKQYWVA